MTHTTHLLLLVTLGFLACEVVPTATPKVEVAAKVAPSAVKVQKKLAERGPVGSSARVNEAGPVFFAVDHKGVVRLDKGKFTRLRGGPEGVLKNLHVAGDGGLWVLGLETLYRLPTFDADEFEEVAKGSSVETGSIDDYFVVSASDIWAVGPSGISHWDGQGWTMEDKSALGTDESVPNSVAIDDEGKVWVASSEQVHVKEEGVWNTLDLSKINSGQIFMKGLERAPDGKIYGLAAGALFRLGPEIGSSQAVVLGEESFPSYSHVAFGPGGTIAARNLFDLVVAPPGMAKARVWKRGDYLSEDLRALAVDGSGRAWLGTKIGVTILGPGTDKVEWPTGSVRELAGVVDGVAVVGSGPTELPEVGAVKTGGLTGRIVREDLGVAEVEVELCPSPGMMFAKSPCAGSSLRFAGKTDERGVWRLDEVPLGVYGMAIRAPESKWKITIGSRVGIQMMEGELYDTGSLALK